jgi:hypothetical protein
LLAAVAGKAEAHLVAVDGDMPILESGQAVAGQLRVEDMLGFVV